jgi:hypothetical protein
LRFDRFYSLPRGALLACGWGDVDVCDNHLRHDSTITSFLTAVGEPPTDIVWREIAITLIYFIAESLA